jgi:hypothetical protein
MNSHCHVGLVSRQWDAVDWACVLCNRRFHNDRASTSASSRQCAWPFYSSLAGFSWQSITSPSSVSLPTAKIWLTASSASSQSLNHRWNGGDLWMHGHTVHNLSQRRLTADWLAPRESDCSWMRSKVCSDWLTSYIKATRPVLLIFSKWLDTFRTALVKCPVLHWMKIMFVCSWPSVDVQFGQKVVAQFLSFCFTIKCFKKSETINQLWSN